MKKKGTLSRWYLGLVLLFIYLPIFVVILYSFNDSRINSVWKGTTTHWYKDLLENHDLLGALKNSVFLGLISSTAAAVIGTLGAVGISKLTFIGKGGLEFLSTFPIMTPEIILGTIFLAFFGLIGLPLGMMALIIAHTAFSIPYVYMTVKSRLAGMDPSYEEAARDLGASAGRAFWDVTFPAIIPGILSGMLLAFAMSMDDVVISILLNGPESNTLAVKIYSSVRFGVSPMISALATMMFLITTVLVVLAGVIGNGNQDRANFMKEKENL